MKKLPLLLAFICFYTTVSAQDDLFGTTKPEGRKGVIFGVHGNLDFPQADMGDRFGTSYRVGASILFKSKSNWILGTKMDFIVGSKIKEDSLMHNITDEFGNHLNQDGDRIGVAKFERGYMIGIEGGRIFNTSKKNSDNGVIALTGVGFMQHKINIFDRDKTIPSLRGDNRKGYDRLTNGLYVSQYVGYAHFSNSGLINFNIGIDFTAGFTKMRRDYQFDLMRGDNSSRVDILLGIRGGWYIPVFKRKSEEFFFE